ncbi:helix-turn-helix domain-containing protein [Metaclostridioides mangenotii]|uniref:Transcriptional regulator with XRE-family HTH domain n=1 Tax=Metaclostridioides mangenotii TaxID=1540 RepID=A0ABS4E7V3_9FIRM|nr:helix-turn-helix domain-containing protein [Clostridioides mangenotii]MBP1854025.1 transcriptional regulator with XRE-family HTH domain [Clostridioides mangenotii]
MSIGENIIRVRKIKKISQKELAEKSGISVNGLLNYEKDYREPTYTAIEKIADVLKVKASVLTYWLDDAVTCADISDFLNSLYPYDSYHDKNITEDIVIGNSSIGFNHTISLPKFIGDDDVHRLMELFDLSYDNAVALFYGDFLPEFSTSEFYYKFVEIFGLTEEQFYSFLVTLEIADIIEKNAYINTLNNKNIQLTYVTVLSSEIIDPQPIDDLIKNGLNDKNIANIINFISSSKILDYYGVAINNEGVSMKKDTDNINTITINVNGLPQNAIDEIKEYIEFVKHKYHDRK